MHGHTAHTCRSHALHTHREIHTYSIVLRHQLYTDLCAHVCLLASTCTQPLTGGHTCACMVCTGTGFSRSRGLGGLCGVSTVQGLLHLSTWSHLCLCGDKGKMGVAGRGVDAFSGKSGCAEVREGRRGQAACAQEGVLLLGAPSGVEPVDTDSGQRCGADIRSRASARLLWEPSEACALPLWQEAQRPSGCSHRQVSGWM